jgi:23S rRNA (adenine2503-C2)-methyltransferase
LKIIKNIEVPTGNILVVEGEKGKLECLSLGDYGKDVNVKADFLNLKRIPDRITHQNMLPLEDKWVITISSQYGCSMGCKFCDVPNAGAGINATMNDMIGQVFTARDLHPEVKQTKRLNLHYARMGEPTWNDSVISSALWLTDRISGMFNKVCFHPVVSTMMPKTNKNLSAFIEAWCFYKNENQKGEAGLQLSINSTNEKEREWMFSSNALTLEEIGKIVKNLPSSKGRKYTLNFAIATYEIDPNTLLRYFDPNDWICKLTPMHKTNTALKHDIKTEGDYTEIYPYLKDEQSLKDAGYDVLVFVASEYEDLGRITCGNALLGGSKIKVPFKIIYQ